MAITKTILMPAVILISNVTMGSSVMHMIKDLPFPAFFIVLGKDGEKVKSNVTSGPLF